jgi:signal transduction protein with GAF and PtsI domain
MNVKDLLQMNDQMIAFNALIKGDLAKEVKQAKEALDALGSAQSIAAAQAKVDADLLEYNTYVEEKTTLFTEIKEALKQEQENVNKSFDDLREVKLAISKAKDELVTAQDKLLNDTDLTNKAISDAWKDLALATAKVKRDQDELKETFANIAKRETNVAEKLAAIKALAK